MNLLKKVAKIPLDFIAFCLRKSPAALYYLVNEPLKSEILATCETAFGFQHIENAVKIAGFASNQTGVIVDVGGGIANTAKLFSGHFPNKKIYIFEPIKSSFEIIKQQKQANWVLINKAAGNAIGQSTINITNRVTASSLLEVNAEIDGYGESLAFKGTETIDLTTLDHEIPASEAVLILKLDVQGFEMEVLKGAKAMLLRTKIVVLEINNHAGYRAAPTYFEIDEFFRKNNFELYDLLPSARVNGKLQDWDAIYVNRLVA